MGGFTQPQQKYAGTFENCNIAIFYPINKTFWKFLYISFGSVSTQIFRENGNFKNIFKISQNFGVLKIKFILKDPVDIFDRDKCQSMGYPHKFPT